jgi:hypothetical protein
MKDADGTIERLLAGLREVEPPGGMERRILEALDGAEAREVVISAWPWRAAMGLLLACAAMLTLAIMVRRPSHPRADSNNSSHADARPATRPELTKQKAPAGARPVVSHASMRRPHAIQAAGFPAPPLPLTQQERLLLILAHRGDPANMAILNPDVQAVLIAKSTQEFQQFFQINALEMRSESE